MFAGHIFDKLVSTKLLMTSEAFVIKALVSAPRAGEASGLVALHSEVLEGRLLGWGPQISTSTPCSAS